MDLRRFDLTSAQILEPRRQLHHVGLRRVAEVLGATIRVTIAPKEESAPMTLSETKVAYKIRGKSQTANGHQ